MNMRHSLWVVFTSDLVPTLSSHLAQIWVVVIGGMNAYQESVETNYILHVADTGEDFECVESALPASSTYTCADRTHTRRVVWRCSKGGESTW